MSARMGRTIRRWVWVCAFVIVAAFSVAPRVKAQTLTNADVIKMVQAKLGDAVIVSKIKTSTCRFDTSTDALIKLKQAGVSDKVLEAMTEAGHAGNREGAISRSPKSTVTIPVPENYGIYVAVDGKLLKLGRSTFPKSRRIKVRTWDSEGFIGTSYNGGKTTWAAAEVGLVTTDVLPNRVVFVKSGYSNVTIRLVRLPFVRSVMHPACAGCPTRAYAVNAWDAEVAFPGSHPPGLDSADAEMQTESMPGHKGITKYSPVKPLSPGLYSLVALQASTATKLDTLLLAVEPLAEGEQRNCFAELAAGGGFKPCSEVPIPPNEIPTLPQAGDASPSRNSGIRPGATPTSNVSPNPAIMDEFNGSSVGEAYGITYVPPSSGEGALFSRQADSRIEYANRISEFRLRNGGSVRRKR